MNKTQENGGHRKFVGTRTPFEKSGSPIIGTINKNPKIVEWLTQFDFVEEFSHKNSHTLSSSNG